MFFLDVLLVAPNRTRPPMKIGLQIFEHAHNVSMGKVRSACAHARTHTRTHTHMRLAARLCLSALS